MILEYDGSVNKIREFYEKQISDLKLAIQAKDKEIQDTNQAVTQSKQETEKLKVILICFLPVFDF